MAKKYLDLDSLKTILNYMDAEPLADEVVSNLFDLEISPVYYTDELCAWCYYGYNGFTASFSAYLKINNNYARIGWDNFAGYYFIYGEPDGLNFTDEGNPIEGAFSELKIVEKDTSEGTCTIEALILGIPFKLEGVHYIYEEPVPTK